MRYMYCVYIHINRYNHKVYVGITGQLPESRWGRNGINYKKSSPRFWSAIVHYGWDAFDHIIIKEGLTRKDACALEIALIDYYCSQDTRYGYNIMSGGDAPEMPQSVRDKLSVALKNNQNGKGHPCSEDKKNRISASQKGRRFTDEHKRKLSEAKRGKSHAPPSEETRKKISDAHKKRPVYCVETETVYLSIQEAARQTGLLATSICACCKGKHKSIGGFHFQYYNNAINA